MLCLHVVSLSSWTSTVVLYWCQPSGKLTKPGNSVTAAHRSAQHVHTVHFAVLEPVHIVSFGMCMVSFSPP